MGVIRWDNINAPRIGEAAIAFNGATNAFNSGFDRLNAVIKDREKIGFDNWDQQKSNNTAAFLDEISKYRTPEEYQAALASGALDQMRQGFGVQIDASKARTAQESALATLQQREKQANEYADYTTTREQLPVVREVERLIASGDHAGARKMLEANNLSNEAPIYNALTAAEQKKIEQDRANLLAPMKNRIELATLQEQERTIANTATLRQLDTEATAAQQAYLADKERKEVELGNIAKKLGYAVDAAGKPNITDEGQKAKLFHAATLAGIVDASGNLAGDTAAADRYMRSLEKSGRYSPEILREHSKKIRSGFDSTQPGLVGQDANDRDVKEALHGARMKELGANTWYAPGSDDALTANKELRGEIGNLEKDEFEAKKLNELVHKYATTGFKLKNGVTVVPSNNDILSAIASTRDDIGWNVMGMGFATHADNVHKLLEERLNTPEALKRFAESEELRRYKLKQDSKAILKAAK